MLKEISSVTSKFNDQINAIRNQSVISNKSLKKTINASKQEIIKVQSTEKLGVQEEIKNLEKTIEAAYNDFNNQREEAKKNRDKNLNNLKEKKQVIENLNKDIEKYQDELAKVKAEKSNLTKTNIVYNLATHLTTIVKSCEGAENSEDVTPQCRKVTENIWFGLISFIVSALRFFISILFLPASPIVLETI